MLTQSQNSVITETGKRVRDESRPEHTRTHARNHTLANTRVQLDLAGEIVCGRFAHRLLVLLESLSENFRSTYRGAVCSVLRMFVCREQEGSYSVPQRARINACSSQCSLFYKEEKRCLMRHLCRSISPCFSHPKPFTGVTVKSQMTLFKWQNPGEKDGIRRREG